MRNGKEIYKVNNKRYKLVEILRSDYESGNLEALLC
jgi:hypothetical protein